jgi:hypothetical protein
LLDGSNEYKAVRERWAELTNQALREANMDARVDHRSLAVQGVDREPGPSIPHRFLAMERQGIRTTVAAQIRENYRRRMEARAARAIEAGPRSGMSLERIRRDAAQAWLRYREGQRSASQEATPRREAEDTRDHDHSL